MSLELLTTPSYAEAVIGMRPVAYLPLAGSALALIGDDGSAFNSPSPGAVSPRGDSLAFNGSNQSVNVPHDERFDFGTGAFAVGLWFRGTNTSQLQCFLAKGSLGGSPWAGWDMLLRGELSSNLIQFRISTASSASSIQFNATSLLTGDWHFLMGLRHANGDYELWADGNMQASGNNPNDVDSTNSLRIARRSASSTWFAEMEMQHVFVFDRAPTAAEHRHLYLAGINGVL